MPPAGMPRVDAAAPSSCSYWKRAAEGHAFYTEATDQLNCPIGAYTHNVDMPPATQQELDGSGVTQAETGRKLNVSELVETPSGRIVRWLGAGSGFLAQHSKELVFGLGRYSSGITARVRWPGGKSFTVDVPAGAAEVEISIGGQVTVVK